MSALFASVVAQIKAKHRADWDGYAFSAGQNAGDEPNLPVILCTCGVTCYAATPDVDFSGESEGAESAWGDHLIDVTADAVAAARLIASDADRASSWSDDRCRACWRVTSRPRSRNLSAPAAAETTP